MKGEDLSGLANRIRQELTELEHVVERINEGWQRAPVPQSFRKLLLNG